MQLNEQPNQALFQLGEHRPYAALEANRPCLKELVSAGCLALLLAVCLFAGTTAVQMSQAAGLAAREVMAAYRDAQTQWMIFVCAALYFALFCALRRAHLLVQHGRRSAEPPLRFNSPHHSFER